MFSSMISVRRGEIVSRQTIMPPTNNPSRLSSQNGDPELLEMRQQENNAFCNSLQPSHIVSTLELDKVRKIFY